MKSSIRKIGNLKSVILPQSFLKQCAIEGEVSIEVRDNSIVISAPKYTKRKGWENAFRQMAINGDDKLAMPDQFNDEEFQNWK